jgi:hypothetical protein
MLLAVACGFRGYEPCRMFVVQRGWVLEEIVMHSEMCVHVRTPYIWLDDQMDTRVANDTNS